MRLARLSTRGKPLRVPVRSTSIDFSSSSPRPPVKGCLGSHRAMPCEHSSLSASSDRAKDTSGRRSAILHFKNEHPLFRAVTESLAGVAPGAPVWTGSFTRSMPASVGASNSVTSVLFSPRVGAPISSDVPSPPDRFPLFAGSDRATEAASPAQDVKSAGVLQPRTPSSGKELFSSPLLVPHSVFYPAWVQRSSSIRPAEVANPRELGPVRSPQPQPRLASRARRALTRFCNLSTRNPGTPTKDRSSHEPNAFARLVCPTRPCDRPSCERYGTELSLF